MEAITRRYFMSAMGVAGAAAAAALGTSAAPARADETPATPGGSFAEGMLDLGWSGTPDEIKAIGGSTMPLEELNRRRQAYIDSKTEDWVCADGTVIPAVYLKVYALVNSYGMGCGNTPTDDGMKSIANAFTEDEALAYTQMPFGEKFTYTDFYAKSGRPLEECEEICNHFADEGLLARFERNNGTTFHQIPNFQGAAEYQYPKLAFGGDPITVSGADLLPGVFRDGGTPFFYAVPCDKSVVIDDKVLPYDDVEQIIMSKNKFSISPCPCDWGLTATDPSCPSFEEFLAGEHEDYISPVTGLRTETCIMMGDEAECWINLGIAREITREQALEYVKRSAEDGFILQSCFTKDTETICSCHKNRCGIIGMWMALGGAADVANGRCFGQVSHYNLVVDLDKCLKCGACANRCPLGAITMGEDGYPQVNEMCFRCGQCAYICPAEARKLTARPEEENLELPTDYISDANLKAAFRFEAGLIQ